MPDFIPLPIVTSVIGYEKDRLVEWGIRTPLATMVHRFEFEPLGEGRSTVRHHEYARGLLAILARPLKGKIEAFDRQFAKDMEASIRNGLHKTP